MAPTPVKPDRVAMPLERIPAELVTGPVALPRTMVNHRGGVSIDEAADMIWATNSAELYVLLTGERGWSPDHYERWLADTWCRLLLRSDPTSAL